MLARRTLGVLPQAAMGCPPPLLPHPHKGEAGSLAFQAGDLDRQGLVGSNVVDFAEKAVQLLFFAFQFHCLGIHLLCPFFCLPSPAPCLEFRSSQLEWGAGLDFEFGLVPEGLQIPDPAL